MFTVAPFPDDGLFYLDPPDCAVELPFTFIDSLRYYYPGESTNYFNQVIDGTPEDQVSEQTTTLADLPVGERFRYTVKILAPNIDTN